MRLRFAVLLPLLLLAPAAHASQVKSVQPLAIPADMPVRVVGMDVEFAPEMLAELQESDAKAARKRAAAQLPALDADSYSAVPVEQAQYSTLPFKQMFPLVTRDVTQEWGLVDGTPVILKVRLDYLKTADAAMAIIVAWSSDMLQGTVEVIDATHGGSLGVFRVEVRNTHMGWGLMAIRGWGIREKLAEEFGLELSRYIADGKRKANFPGDFSGLQDQSRRFVRLNVQPVE